MKVLVTGSNGFIGREVCAELRSKGHKVVEFSLSKGKDISSRAQLGKELEGCDALIHLAALLSETKGAKEMRTVNVEGTRNVLEACIAAKVKRFVFISTVGVYGGNDNEINEGTKRNPITLYEKTKAEAEKLVWECKGGLEVSVVRPAIVYGPDRTWKKFFKMARNNWPLVGSGRQVWQLVYVKDLARAIVLVLESRKAIGEDYVVANPERFEYRKLTEEIAKACGKKYKPVKLPVWFVYFASYFPYAIAKLKKKESFVNPSTVKRLVRNRKYDTGKITKLGWKPKYSLVQGLKETWKEMQKQKN